nr:uncharacterized protein LOC123496851 [Aegilops tauschii subsp. strangulata]
MSDEGNEIDAEIGYDGDDGGSEDGSLSLDEDEHDGENYMSLDESYSGNIRGDDDNEDMDVDDSYAESGSHGEVGGACENDDDADGDECNFDSGYDEYQQEPLDRHWTVMSTTFRIDEEAYDFYNDYAKKRGFSIRKDNLKYAKGIDARRRLRRFLCSRAGKRQAKFCTMEGKKRRLRAETPCYCEAHLTVKLDRERSIWYVSSFNDDHSHTLARPDEVIYLRSHNQIKEYQKLEILAMAGVGLKKHWIYDNFVTRYGSYARAGFGRRKLYNMCYREKIKLLAKDDADTAIGIMMTRKARDPDFFFEHSVDAEGKLKNMFWCDSQSRRDYLDFGDVIVFDSTYKMNRRDGGYICLGVADLLESSLSEEAEKHLHHKSLKEFRSLIYYATTHDEFEARWAAFRAKWESEKTETWLRRMYRKKRLWAASYLTGGFFLGMRSNQRSESLNSCLHMHLDSGMTIVDMVVHYENCIVRLRENKSHDDCMSTQTLPVPVVDEFKCIEKAAARDFAAVNFYLLQIEMKKAADLEIIDRLSGAVSRRFIVAWKNNRQLRFKVDYTPTNSEETVKCSCDSMKRKGLPCKHVLYVLARLNMKELPKCLVLRRFTKNARGGLP